MTRSDVLISADELLTRMAGTPAPRLLDVRWTLPKPDGREDFAAGHIPGALYVDLDTELADHGESTDPTAGGHPLPSPEAFQETVRSWGIDEDTEVVVYDDNSSLGAARAWWLLRWAGLNARVLDGGLAAFRDAGGTLEAGDSPRSNPQLSRSALNSCPSSTPRRRPPSTESCSTPAQLSASRERPSHSIRRPVISPGRRTPRPRRTSPRGPSCRGASP